MSILSSIIEQSSATIPYNEAKPVTSMFNSREDFAKQQKIMEEIEREIIAEDNQHVGIDGLSSHKAKSKKKKRVEETKQVRVKSKNKKFGNFMDEEEIEEEIIEEVSRDVPTEAYKINGLLSKLCNNYDSKGNDESVEIDEDASPVKPNPIVKSAPVPTTTDKHKNKKNKHKNKKHKKH